jgi:signal peptidase I
VTAYLLAAGVVAAAVALVAVARRRWVVVTVEGNSMSPTLHDGQRLVARRLIHPRIDQDLSRGDIIVFVLPSWRDNPELRHISHRVKRIAAVPGDLVPEWARQALAVTADARVPEGQVVVMGDNPVSQDSRELGYIDAHCIVAVVRA